MKYFKSILAIFVFCPLLMLAQENNRQEENITISRDESITRMMDSFIRINKKNPEFDGYRVQIFFESGTNSKRLSTDARDLFVSRYPETKAYLIYKEPYYMVRVGNFRTMNEAVGFQKKIAVDYPNAFPVKDKISYKDL